MVSKEVFVGVACQSTSIGMPESKVSQKNIASYQDDQCCSLELSVVLILLLISL